MDKYADSDADYFIFRRDGDDTYPLLGFRSGADNTLRDRKPVAHGRILQLVLADPVPRFPVMGDFLVLSAEPVVSQRVCDLLAGLNIRGVQLVPAEIAGKGRQLFRGYYAMRVYNRIGAVDRRCAVCDHRYGMLFVLRISLDRRALGRIPLRQRLVFVLEESPDCMLFHRSVVDKIMAIKPTGARFIPVYKYIV